MDSYKIAAAILNATDLTAMEKLVSLVLAHYYDKKQGGTRVRTKRIAEKAGCSQGTVKRAVKALQIKGYISSIRSEYEIPLLVFNTRINIGLDGGVTQTPPGITQTPPPAKKRRVGDGLFHRDTTHSTRFEEEQKRPMLMALDRAKFEG